MKSFRFDKMKKDITLKNNYKIKKVYIKILLFRFSIKTLHN